MRFMMLLAAAAIALSSCSNSDDPVATATTQTSPTSTTASTQSSAVPATTAPATSTPATTEAPTTTAPPVTTTAPTTTSTTLPANCPEPGSTTTVRIPVAGLDRKFILEIPPAESATLRPAILDFHGLGSTGFGQSLYSNMSNSAHPLGFVVVTPDGEGSPRQWIIEGIQTDEPASINFVNALLDEIIANACVDPDQIFATGMSSGGLMSSMLGCVASERIAAIAPVALTAWDDNLCAAGSPIPIVSFHGTADAVIDFYGAPTSLVPSGRLGDVRENMEQWAAHNGCNPDATETLLSTDVQLIEWECPKGAETLLYVIIEGGHTWPGAIRIPTLGYTTKEIDATDTITDFFAMQAGE